MIENLNKSGAEMYFEEGRYTISNGRNGQYFSKGVDLYANATEIQLTGITKSGGMAATGKLTIPKEDLPELITLLKYYI